MKRILTLSVLAIMVWSIQSCNTAGNKDNHVTVEQAVDNNTFKPSGDLQKDAQVIADMIISSSQRMIQGEASLEEDQALADQMIKVANDYYQSQNLGEEFQEALHEATETAIDSLGVILGKGQR